MYGQLLNAQMENSSGNPASGGTPLGRIYIDSSIVSTSHGIPLFYDGTGYVPFGQALVTLNNTATASFNVLGVSETICNTSGTTISAVTLTLPSTSAIGQIVRYVSKSAVTTLTVSGTVTVGATITSLTTNQTIAYQAINTTGSYIRIA